jgi:ribosomal protein L11 methyltransferase
MWQQQWELFAPNFKNGKAHIDLRPYGGNQDLLLAPGGGFGDFSHPTTRLTLKMMAPHVKGATVIDIGCGSGILSLAAAFLGAEKVYGIDIDPEALAHSFKNLKINKLENTVHFSEALPPLSLKESVVTVLNMIPAEQKTAWETQKMIHPIPQTIVTSGVLIEAKPSYLEWASKQGWSYLSEHQEDQWLSISFLKS